MITLLEISLLCGVIFLLAGVGLMSFKRVRIGLLSICLGVFAAVSAVSQLNAISEMLDRVRFKSRADLVTRIGMPSYEIRMSEGDSYYLYRLRISPWKRVVVFNLVDEEILSRSSASDYEYTIKDMGTRSPLEAEIAKKSIYHVRQQKVNDTGQP